MSQGVQAKGIFDAVQSIALSVGVFQSVATEEPKSAPKSAPHCALYGAGIRPYQKVSGLAATSVVVVLMARIYMPFLSEPRDAIDPGILVATDVLMNKLTGGFTLGGKAMAIDLLGASGTGLSAQAGYIDIDGEKFRSMDIQIPVIQPDVWTQEP